MLMLVFLPLSMAANFFVERYSFVVLYFFLFIATLYQRYCFNKNLNINEASEQILIILLGMTTAFFFIGEQSSFDALWILVVPIVAVMTSSLKRLRLWLTLSIALLVSLLSATYAMSELIAYEPFALFSLLWALFFVSYLAYSYKEIQLRLEKKVHLHQQTLESKIQNAVCEIEQLNSDLIETQKEILERLGTLGEYRSKETGTHVRRVGAYTQKLALLAGLDAPTAALFKYAAPLHDIGKVGIADAILNKPGKLTQEEFKVMQEHALIGEKILSNSNKPLIQIAAAIAGGHHEKYDGSGYPRGLKGEAIPLSARIVTIVDVFDALYSARIYKEAWSLDSIIEHFKNERAKHFDPHLVDLFLENIAAFVAIYEES